MEGTTPEILALHGCYADLLVLGRDDPESDSAGLLETVLFDSGRPVLAIPFAGSFKSIGKRVLVGWNASREATRTLHDALPLIAKAENATVFLTNPKRGLGAHGEEPGARYRAAFGAPWAEGRSRQGSGGGCGGFSAAA
ncbi:MAG: hypothetical protein ACKO54_13055 [Alphaproteobacteria bacterium]